LRIFVFRGSINVGLLRKDYGTILTSE